MRRLLISVVGASLLVVVVIFAGCEADREEPTGSESPAPSSSADDLSGVGIFHEGASELERQAALDNAYEEGYGVGYEEGYREGRNDAHQQGYDEGYDEGYYVGFDEGCVALGDRLIEIGALGWYRCPSP